MRRKYLNSVIPFTAELKKLFKKDSVKEVRDTLNGPDGSEGSRVEGGDLIPGVVEVPLQTMIDAGFSVKFYLKDATDAAVDTYDSGIIIASIQHEDPASCTLIDGLSYQFDAKSEVEISTICSAIVNNDVPDAFGEDYNIQELFGKSSDRIREINTEMANNKSIRDKKIADYEANPEKARKHTKKALENLRQKHVEMINLKGAGVQDVEKFQENALRLIGEIFGINNVSSFEDLKKIPEIKEEIEKGGSLTELLTNLSDIVSAKVDAEEKAKIANDAIAAADAPVASVS